MQFLPSSRLLAFALLCLLGAGLSQGGDSKVDLLKRLLELMEKRARGKPSSCTSYYPSTSTMCMYWDSKDVIESGISSATREEIVQQHNGYRTRVSPSAVNMAKMYWDEELAKVAQKWSKTCPRGGHDTVANRMVPGYGIDIGQNLAWGLKSWSDAVASWHAAVSLHTYGTLKSYLMVTQYAQIVHDVAVRIGCGFTRCSSGTFYVCNYAKAQDLDIAHPYKSGKSCQSCPTSCEDELCDCQGLLCKNGGTLDLNSCTCQCASGWGENGCSKAQGKVANPGNVNPAVDSAVQSNQVSSCPPNIKDRSYCPTYPKSYCTRYPTWPDRCPIKCGKCTGSCAGKTCTHGHLNADCTCTCMVGWTGHQCQQTVGGSRCPGKVCQHHGTLQADCTCSCLQQWMGDSCQYMACGPDASYCAFYKSYCNYRFIRDACKKTCRVC